MTPKELAIRLATIEKERDIVTLLADHGYWNDYQHWRPFGDNDNNFSTIGNQQSKPDAALVEKFINSVDAILMKECLIRNIDMTGPEAPQSMSAALQLFFKIREGQLSFLDTKTRSKMAENIVLAATGNTFHVNFAIIDQGEGQTPKKMPETILSVSKNNKLRVPFVQGKFNMGGTGVLPFCGENRLQLVISKRCPDIPNVDQDETHHRWSVTLVRREPAREGRRSSMFTYLTDSAGNLFSFEAKSIPVIPRPQGLGYEDMYYGTYIKLFDYALQGYKSNVQFDFTYRMSMLMPELAHPIRIRECRKKYKGHSLETTLSGLQTRLDEDRQSNVEDGFPSSDTFNVDGQNFRCSIYVFKKGRAKNYREKDGVLYVVNGQTHAVSSESFFNRVNLSYLADSLLVLIDCSDIDVQHREDMFMNSRDRLRSGDFSKNVQSRIKDILAGHAGLKKLQHDRRAAAINEKVKDDKPLQDVLQNILVKSPVLSKILLAGNRLANPFNMTASAGESDVFIGKKHPTFFTIKGKLNDGKLTKVVPLNHDFRVQFETDADNDYFVRPAEKGMLLLKMSGATRPEMVKHLGLFNGTATLTIALPKTLAVGEECDLHISIVDDCITQTFENIIHLIVEEDKEFTSGGRGKRTPPEDPNKKGSRNKPNVAAMPNIEEKYRVDWHEFSMDEHTALKLYKTDEGSDYFLNMDNQYLLTELKGIRDQNRLILTKARYKYGMVLLGMSIESYYKNQDSNGDDSPVIPSEVEKITTMLAPVLVPMLDSMAELDID